MVFKVLAFEADLFRKTVSYKLSGMVSDCMPLYVRQFDLKLHIMILKKNEFLFFFSFIEKADCHVPVKRRSGHFACHDFMTV